MTKMETAEAALANRAGPAQHHRSDPFRHARRSQPEVKQSTIKKTICKSGWTATIRPPVSYTNALKIKQMVLYEETGSPSDYEEVNTKGKTRASDSVSGS